MAQYPGGSSLLVSITEIAVPLFFMISGATILNSSKTKSIQYLFKHRLIRVLIPFLLWSVLSAFLVPIINNSFDLQNFISSLLLIYHQPVLMAYWFIYALVALYLVSPFLKVLVDGMSRNMIDYFLILWLIVNIFLPAMSQSLPKDIAPIFDLYSLGRIIFSPSLGYFILGYRLTQEHHSKVNLRSAILIASVLMVINIIIRFIHIGSNWYFLNTVSAVNIPVIATLVFLCFKSLERSYSSSFSKIVEFLAPLTYGVYLLHGIIIEVVEKLIGSGNYPSIFLLSILFSTVIIFILKKIPGLNKVLV